MRVEKRKARRWKKAKRVKIPFESETESPKLRCPNWALKPRLNSTDKWYLLINIGCARNDNFGYLNDINFTS
jgi:hypothetical protein